MKTRLASAAAAFVTAALTFILAGHAWSDDRRDSPDLQNTLLVGQLDLGSLYVFRSPANANNTVLILLAGPHSQIVSRPFFDPKAQYEIKIDSTRDAKADLTFRFRFGQPDPQGVQKMKVQRMIGRQPFRTLLNERTFLNVPLEGGGMVRAGLFDDPLFFDAFAFDGFATNPGGGFPRPVGLAKNFFGPSANILGIVIEVPSAALVKAGVEPVNNQIIGVWGRVLKNGVQADRVGRPMTNIALIPPLPRNAATKDLRKLFNRGQPHKDLRVFGAAMRGVFTNFYGRTEEAAMSGASSLLPDVLLFQLGNPNGFGTFIMEPGDETSVLGNGRRLRDDVVDIALFLITGGSITTDNVPDDNGTRITDGNMGTTAAFPYIGPANVSVTGPNP